jgi:hypothetical protein
MCEYNVQLVCQEIQVPLVLLAFSLQIFGTVKHVNFTIFS